MQRRIRQDYAENVSDDSEIEMTSVVEVTPDFPPVKQKRLHEILQETNRLKESIFLDLEMAQSFRRHYIGNSYRDAAAKIIILN